MPLSHTPCCPLPEVELLRRKPISPEEAAARLNDFFEQEAQTGAAELATSGAVQVSYSHVPHVLERLQNDWVGHPESRFLDCFVEVHARMEVHLNPCFLGARLKQGLRKTAGAILLKYQRVLGCIPLTMADLKPAGSGYGALVGDAPYVHFLTNFRCVGFAPQKGHWVLGRLAREQVSPHGMNISILNLVNIYVQRASLPRELRYVDNERAWFNDEKQLSDRHLVLVKIDRVDTSVERLGDMGIELTGILETVGHIKKKNLKKPEFGAASPAASTPGRQAAPEETPKKRRRAEGLLAASSLAEPASAPNGDAKSMDIAREEPRQKKRKSTAPES